MPRAFFEDDAFFEPGAFFEAEVVVVQPPSFLNLGAPGEAVYALPFRGLGGSVLDLDLLYGLIGKEGTTEDIQPIFAIATRHDMIRAFGKEMPRQAIQDTCVESFATLLHVDDITIDGSPVGPNLFGSVGLTTLATFGVTLDNSDGYLSQLMLRELVMYAPAGIFADIAHTVPAAVVTGTIHSIVFDGSKCIIQGGMSARVTNSRSLLPRMNLDQRLDLRTAKVYANPASETDILPEVFGNWLDEDVSPLTSTEIGTPAVLIDTFNVVYCVNARPTDPSPPLVFFNGIIQEPSVYEWNPANDYEGHGVIATLQFRLNYVMKGTVMVRHGGALTVAGLPVTNPIEMLYIMFNERAHWTLDSFDLGTCQQTRRDLAFLGYPAHFVWAEDKSIREWLLEWAALYHCDFTEGGNGTLAIVLDRTLTPLPITPDYHAWSHELEDGGSPATAVRLEMQGDDVVNQVTLHARHNWVENQPTVDYTWDYPQSQSAYQAAYPAEFTFRGMYTMQHATQWLQSFALRHGFDPTLVSFTLRGLKGIPLIPPRLITLEWPFFGWSERLLKIIKTTISWEEHRISLGCVDCQRELDEQPDTPPVSPTSVRQAQGRVYQWLPGAVGDLGNLADAPTETRNEAANGDLERGNNGQWNLGVTSGIPQWEFVLQAAEAYQGRYYLRSIPGAGDGLAYTLRRRVDPGQVVLVSTWFQQHVGGTDGEARSTALFFDSDDQFLMAGVGNPVVPHTSYLESVTFTRAPAQAYYYRPGIYFSVLPTAGIWRADSIFAISGTEQEVVASRPGEVNSRNAVINGNFELGNMLFSTGRTWEITNHPALPAHSGVWYAAHHAESAQHGPDYLFSNTAINVVEGQTFTFHAFGRTAGNPNGFANLGASWVDRNGDIFDIRQTANVFGPLPDWTHGSGAMEVPVGAVWAYVWVSVTNHTGDPNSFWFLDSYLVE